MRLYTTRNPSIRRMKRKIRSWMQMPTMSPPPSSPMKSRHSSSRGARAAAARPTRRGREGKSRSFVGLAETPSKAGTGTSSTLKRDCSSRWSWNSLPPCVLKATAVRPPSCGSGRRPCRGCLTESGYFFTTLSTRERASFTAAQSMCCRPSCARRSAGSPSRSTTAASRMRPTLSASPVAQAAPHFTSASKITLAIMALARKDPRPRPTVSLASSWSQARAGRRQRRLWSA
mmetsp:Transcript_142/g.572  ORF Transcript_142/g.572 Transcript_142/m.572 type:complete len:231 (-) Transcript_142:223-915(-)